MPEPVHINLQAAVDAVAAMRDALRQAAEDAKREDAAQPTPLPPFGGGGTVGNGRTG